ncbi:MAG TPA: ABC transporter ATP-binding protein [Mycobacteriales bacterium]|nr:ABC transporter ATP-binding protein [Mycobacteriales bacterium]
MAAVAVSHLAKRYTPTAGVVDVSFEAPAGAVTALLGRNGAGKTTSVEVCCGLRRADSGDVRVLGLDPYRDHAELAPRVGVMPQTGGSGACGIYPSVRVGEVVRHYAAMYADPLPVEQLLDRLGLESVAGTPWRRLSGGEQQRVSLALALVGRPEVAFLDEPTAGLDLHARHTTWALIRELRDAGVAVVLTTHALDEAEALADTVTILDHGRVVATGTPAELAKAKTPPTLTFDAPAGLDVAGLSDALPPGASAHEERAGHYVIGPRVDPEVVAAATSWCAAAGVLIDNLSTTSRSLEDVFLEVTAGAPL